MVDYYTTGQYLKFNPSHFWNSSSFSVTWPLNFGPNHVWQVIFLSLCDLYQTWYTGSTRWQMHNGMNLTRIQGQGQGHEPLKVGNSAIFKRYLAITLFTMGAGKWPRILTLGHNTYSLPMGWEYNSSQRWGHEAGPIAQNTYSLSGPVFLFCPSFCVTWIWN